MFRLKNLRFAIIFWPIFALSTAAALLAIPSRWEGARPHTEAYVPLRPVTAQEAAALLGFRGDDGQKYASILRLTGNSAIMGARTYPLILESDISEAVGKTTRNGITYQFVLSNWESFFVIHKVNRNRLEAALGRQLTKMDVDPSLFKNSKPSYNSSHLWLYAAFEIFYLTGSVSLLVFFFLKSGRLLMLLPLLWSFLFLNAVFIPRYYAPAFIDADWFFQRILLEWLWLGSNSLLFVLFLPALVCLAASFFIDGIFLAKGKLQLSGQFALAASYILTALPLGWMSVFILGCGI